MGFSRQEHWRGPFPSLGILPTQGSNPCLFASPTLAGRFSTIVPSRKPNLDISQSSYFHITHAPLSTHLKTHTPQVFIRHIHTLEVYISYLLYFIDGASGKEPACQCRRCKRWGFNPRVRKIPGEGNGNLLQYPCLENSMDGGAWKATVHGVAELGTTELTHREQLFPQNLHCIRYYNLYAEYSTWNARLHDSQAGMKTARRNINDLRYANNITSMAESEEELKSHSMRWKKRVKKLA